MGYVPASVAALPLVMVLQFILTLSLAYAVATFHVTFRDTQYLLGVLLQLLFFLTPIFYDATAIPERYQWLLKLNPMTYLVDAYRAALTVGRLPDWWSLCALSVCSIAMLVYGYMVFMRARYRFVEDV
jgi:lipopolysaccharide transport system permease protein